MYIVWRASRRENEISFERESRSKVADPYPVIRMGSGLPKGRIWTRVFRWGGSGCGLFDGLYLDPVFPKGFIHCSEGLDPVFPKGWIQIRFFRNVLTNVKIK